MGRFPAWLHKRVPSDGQGSKVSAVLRRLGLNAVCRSAHCPNLLECLAQGRATFLLMGPRCTRNCAFCAVPWGPAQPLQPDEPQRVAQAAKALGLRHVVLTSVTRDDLPDGGASHFAATIRAVRRLLPESTVEVLVPDFGGSEQAVLAVLGQRPEVFNHNVETVARLYPAVRPQAAYGRSLQVLRWAAEGGGSLVKSGFMVGLGDSHEEVEGLLRDLRACGCRAVTIGQYLAPSPRHYPVAEFVRPEQFEAYGRLARAMGFERVASGAFVRSSYGAQEMLSGGAA